MTRTRNQEQTEEWLAAGQEGDDDIETVDEDDEDEGEGDGHVDAAVDRVVGEQAGGVVKHIIPRQTNTVEVTLALVGKDLTELQLVCK